MNKERVLACEDLGKSFSDGDEKLLLFESISFSLYERDICVITGPSGCGKSTFLHLLAGFDLPSRGKIYWYNDLLEDLVEKRKSLLRSQYFGFIFQFHHLLNEFNVVENIMLPALLNGLKKRKVIEFAKYLLNCVGLEKKLKRKPNELSGGERQRVAVARALINSPKSVFADEPTGSLDKLNSFKVKELIFTLPEKFSTSLIIVTHDMDFINNATRWFVLENGILKINNGF